MLPDTLAPVDPSQVQADATAHEEKEKANDDNHSDQVQEAAQDATEAKVQAEEAPAPASAQAQANDAQVAMAYATANQRVAFAGYFLVKSATQDRHIRYAMDVSCPELGLKLRFTQRFSAYFYLRKRLLKALKSCCLSAFAIAEWGSEDKPRKCKCCQTLRSQIKKLDFPKRRLFTNVGDIEHRSVVLESFLNSVIEKLVDWQGDCLRGRRLFASVLSRFLGVNIARNISQMIHANTDRHVIEDLRQTMPAMMNPNRTLSECEVMRTPTVLLPQSEASAAQKEESQAESEPEPPANETKNVNNNTDNQTVQVEVAQAS